MVVLRRLDALLEPIKKEVMDKVYFQKVEAGLFLDVLCKEFHEKHIDTPFITVHDSIMVDKSKKEIAYEIFTNGYNNILGITPVLG